MIPEEWLSAIALVRALRDGRDPKRAVLGAARDDDYDSAAPAAHAVARRPYVSVDELTSIWRTLAIADADGGLVGERRAAVVLEDATALMANQGQLTTSHSRACKPAKAYR